MNPLSDLDAAILNFEETAPRSIGRKEEAIRAQLDISPVRYHQRLNLLLDAPRPPNPTRFWSHGCGACARSAKTRGAPRGEIPRIVNSEY